MRRVITNLIVSIALSLSAAACAGNGQPDSGATSASTAAKAGDEGSSFEKPVFFPDAKTEMEGISAEHRWTKTHYPGWHWETQSLVNHEGRAFDVIDISNGSERRRIYFDISNWFGNM